MDCRKPEILSPAGDFTCLQAAIDAGADAVYFGLGAFNMRARSGVNFSEADRSTFAAIREARPDQGVALKALQDFTKACRFANCVPQDSYIGSLLLR